MNESTKTLAQLKKASKLVRLAFRKNGPKSFKRGQGALLNALVEHDGITQRELVCILGLNRGDLKDIVKKAARNGYVTIEDVNEKRTYAVKLTDEGRAVAEKRVAANDKTADDILSCLSDEEIAQLNALTEDHSLAEGQGHQRQEERAQSARVPLPLAERGREPHEGVLLARLKLCQVRNAKAPRPYASFASTWFYRRADVRVQ